MLNCLKAIRLAVEALSNHDANLPTNQGIFKFIFSNLGKQNSALSSMFLKILDINCLNAGIKF
jgi:hypothetical protein